MHRSGTTMLARIFQYAGVHMGPLRDINFESRLYGWDVLNFQNFLLGTWDNPYSMQRNAGSENYRIASDRFRQQILLRNKLHKKITFGKKTGWKHPVASLLIPELRMIPNTRIVSITRNKEDVIKSLSKRKTSIKPSKFPGRFSGGMNVFEKSESARLYEYYTNELDKYQDDIALNLEYERLLQLSSRKAELSKIAKFLEVDSINLPKNFFSHKTNRS